MQNHGLAFNLGSARVCCSPAVFETYFSFHNGTWIAVTYYGIYFYLIVLFPLIAILQLINLTASKLLVYQFMLSSCY